MWQGRYVLLCIGLRSRGEAGAGWVHCCHMHRTQLRGMSALSIHASLVKHMVHGVHALLQE